MIRTFFALALGAVLFGLVAWQFELLPWQKAATTHDGDQPGSAPPINLGELLYKPAAFPKESPQRVRGREPLAVLANFQAVEKIDISAKMPGQILMIGDPVPQGALQVAGVAPFIPEPYYSVEIPITGERKLVQIFRRYYEGSTIGKDAFIAMIDPANVLNEIDGNEAKLEAAIQEMHAAIALDEEYKTRYDREERLFAAKGSNLADLGAARATWKKGLADLAVKKAQVKYAERELQRSQLKRVFHEVRNPNLARKSIIQTLYKKAGESIKENEPIFQVYSLDPLRAEGFIEIQYRDRIKEGALVSIEPTVETEPLRVFAGHRGAINAVAIMPARGTMTKPLGVSASDDKTVCVWSDESKSPMWEFRHDAKVLSLACSPKANLILSGDEEGWIRLFNWDTKEELHKERAYDGIAVTCQAFTPDGEFFATGSASGQIKIWKTDGCTLSWALDAAHGVPADKTHTDAITTLQFTPQCRLVSAGRDNFLRVWEVHQNGVELKHAIDGRGGSVANLGVSGNGQWMTFDQSKILQLRSVEHGKMINYIKAPQGGNAFESIAIISPDDELILTGGGSEGRLQLWKAPIGAERGFEVRQFTPEERGRATCAAFVPPNKEGRIAYAVSGDTKGYVYLWPIPTKSDIQNHRRTEVRVSHVSQNLDAGTRQVKIGVDVPNDRENDLLPGRPVTIVIE
ncbi:MAG: hypothetical protein HY040_08835 [Planctomycetes bacterium]|nr:hypothetical protein [Planctomycetota bacterium]